ncbi:response regulator transcription factor [Actinomadura syzygii]|uniref:Response regulator transcription factor n=1 Tax=Actinomadura syzygii TaxID=1427538 RepID=A0A5D0UIB9_9ACTN|nr:response regulator transcription factor [Actinomadura syzygii]TYC17530.1 response regulator transcription factor [Actinomadura syzygii]
MTYGLLIVEDDFDIGSDLVAVLGAHGYTTALTAKGVRAVQLVRSDPPQIVLVDLGLPDMDGLALCRRLRSLRPELAILVVTARSREFDVVMALDAGADDYLTKPFRIDELLARLRALTRRRKSRFGPAVVSVGGLSVNPAARRVLLGGREVGLRPREFDLLEMLVSRAGQVVSREELMREVWGTEWLGATKTLDVHVCALRRKLAVYGHDPRRITTLRRIGYRYEAEAAERWSAAGG